MWEFIDKIIYINLDKRPKKNEHMKKIVSIFPPDKVIRFSAIEWNPGSVGCTKSHIEVMKMAIDNKWKNVLILEDDVVWNRFESGYILLEKLASQEYDVIHLGPSIPNYDVNTLRLFSGFCTSSYLVNGHYIPKLLSNFQEGLDLLIETKNNKYLCDIYWASLMKTDKWYLCNPCLMYQYEFYSDVDLMIKTHQSLYWKMNPNMVTVELQGGLGNQLFQIAFLDYVSSTNSAIPFLEDTQQVSTHTKQNYFESIFKNWKCIQKSGVKIDKVIREHNLTPQDWKFSNTYENIKLIGYFQHYQYINPDFYKKLDFSDSYYLLEKYKDIANRIFLHIRGGDYLTPEHSKLYSINFKEYYKKAVSMFPKGTQFAVFTNDKPHALTHDILNHIDYQFIDENDIDSLFLMSKCSGGICVNSTFSWWAGILNICNHHALITIPSKWFNNPNLYSKGYYFPKFMTINMKSNTLGFRNGRFKLL
jgi:glycosyl transferase family 25